MCCARMGAAFSVATVAERTAALEGAGSAIVLDLFRRRTTLGMMDITILVDVGFPARALSKP